MTEGESSLEVVLRGCSGPVVKVCGATSVEQVELLAGSGVDLVGLWHGVPGGGSDLGEGELAALSKAASMTGALEPVMVTLSHDAKNIARVASRAGISSVQLHAYQTPAVVRQLREHSPDCLIIKAVHLIDGTCPEKRLLGSYARAGTDLFLIDSASTDGRVGSTGITTPEQEIVSLVQGMALPFLLAGGISAENRKDYPILTGHPNFRGVDVDSGTREEDGSFSSEKIQRLLHAWSGSSR